MNNYTVFMVGLGLGMSIAGGSFMLQLGGYVDDCKLQGYYEYQGEIVKCMVIDKDQLIKHSL